MGLKKVHVSIVPRLTTKFDLTEVEGYPATPFFLREELLPVTSIDELLKTPTIANYDVASTATGWKLATTVPQGKRWTLVAAAANRTTGSSAQVDGIGIRAASESVGTAKMLPLYYAASSGNLRAGVFGQPVILEQGTPIDIFIGTAEAASVVTLSLLYYLEDAFTY